MSQIVVLAGGKGTRLFPLTKKIPKSMIKICNAPFIDHQLKLFKRNGISNVVFCLGTFGQKIIDYLGNQPLQKITIKYSVEKPEKLLGTLGALVNVRELLNDHFFVTYGDSYLDIDYRKANDIFLKSSKSGLMTVFKNQNKFGSSNLDIKNNMITKYDKSNPQQFEYIDYGLMIFKKSVLDSFQLGSYLDLNNLIQKLISKNELSSYEVYTKFFEIGSLDGIKDLENHLKTKTF